MPFYEVFILFLECIVMFSCSIVGVGNIASKL